MELLYTHIPNEDSPGNSLDHHVFLLKAVRLGTSILSPCGCSLDFYLATKPSLIVSPFAIYMRSTDLSQKFSRCSYSDNHASHLRKHKILNLIFLLKQSTASRQPHFWFHPELAHILMVLLAILRLYSTRLLGTL